MSRFEVALMVACVLVGAVLGIEVVEALLIQYGADVARLTR